MKRHLDFICKNSCVLVIYMLMATSLNAQTYLENFQSIRENFTTLNGVSYFFAATSQGESGLWQTDGTQKGTSLVKSFRTGEYDVGECLVYNNELYFAARDQEAGVELWKSDGTTDGTYLLKDLNPSNLGNSSPANFTIYKGMLYFSAVDYYTTGGSRKLFKTDGTSEGTVLADEIIDGYSDFRNAVIFKEKLYFISGTQLYETDGTAEGTHVILVDGLERISSLHSFNNGIYFITHNYNKTYIRLYRLTDIDNHTMIKEFSTESHGGLELYGLAEIDNKVVFSLVSGETYSSVKDTLWATDGTPEGTTELMSQGNRDLWFRPNFNGFVEYKGELYFNAGPAANYALWKTDGTKQGTIEVNRHVKVNSEAPMLVLNDKLYFLSGLSLNAYDGALQETNQVWQLGSNRKSTGDDFFVKSDGRYIYAMVNNLWDADAYDMDFFHIGVNPLMQVSAPYGFTKQGALNFDSKVDSVVIKEISLKNIGNADLAFSKVHVSGEGFYINGETEVRRYGQNSKTKFMRQLAPNNIGVFQIGFLPGSPGAYTGHLIIRSNDTSRPEFRLELRGYASDVPPNSINATFPTEKEIKWNKLDSKIILDSDIISEKAATGDVVGSFSNTLSTESFTYELVTGQGSDDNDIFDIRNNQLVIGSQFQADYKKSYTLRIKATDGNETELEEIIVVGVGEESSEVALGDCEHIAISLTSRMNAVGFLNDTDAIAVGESGIVLKTVDKGRTWRHIERLEVSSSNYSETWPAYLNHVQFVNENVGFLVGEYSIFRTDDAGLNWRPLKFDGISEYGGFKFMAANPDVLFITQGSTLSKSIDGGQTWGKMIISGLYDQKSIYFYNDTLGFISDIYKNYAITNDGGKTWETYKLDEEALGISQAIVDFSFVSEKVGYAVVDSGKVLNTVDGGLTWAVVGSENKTRIRQIEFIDANHGYLVGPQVHETRDGGISWAAIPYETMWSVNQIAVNSVGDGIAVGGGDYGIGRNIYRSLATGDWTNVSEYRGSKVGGIRVGAENLYVFSDNFARMSSDDGATWQEWNTPMEGESFGAKNNGNTFVIGSSNNNEYYRSTDGGLNWHPLRRGDQMGRYDIIEDNIIVSINTEGSVVKSTDLGDTWFDQSIAPEGYGGYLDFLDEFNGFLYGYDGFASTMDGGLTWQEFPVDIEGIFIVSFKFVNTQVGVFFSNKGFFRTNDGGQTWLQMTLNAARTGKITMANELEWYVASNNTIYTTLDGGTTWQTLISGNNEITAFELVDDTLYFGLNAGNVYKLAEEDRPIDAGFIIGDRTVQVGDQEIYTVAKHSNNKYAWTVSGSNRMVSEDDFARVTWNTPGTHTIEVMPYGSCSTGTPETITVAVYEQMKPPQINGLNEVVEGTNEVVYTAMEEEQVRYIWSVTGQRSFHADGNTLTVNWGTTGLHEIGLIKTDLVTGMQAYNILNVNVVPSDPFTILQSDASCRDTPNGSLQITSRLPEVSYMANLTTLGYSSSQEFSNQTLFETLAIGTYDLCIDELNTDKSYCYQFAIVEPEPFEVSSKIVSGAIKKVNLQFKGGLVPYTILVNGRFVAETSQSHYELTAAADDVLEVLTSGNCTFSYSEVLNFNRNIAVSPNPVINSFKAILGKDFNQEVKSIPISFFNSAGRLAFRTSAEISNHTLECDVSVLPSGIYMAQVGNERQISFKIIKQ